MSSSLPLVILLLYHNNIIMHNPIYLYMCIYIYVCIYTVYKDIMEGGEMPQL